MKRKVPNYGRLLRSLEKEMLRSSMVAGTNYSVADPYLSPWKLGRPTRSIPSSSPPCGPTGIAVEHLPAVQKVPPLHAR